MAHGSLHCAIIMDGNGRWATSRGLPRLAGHRKGGEAVRRIIEGAPGAGIGVLTLYAFSADNWNRPKAEVEGLMTLLGQYITRETARCINEGVRIEVIGRRDRLAAALRSKIEAAEHATRDGAVLWLRIAVDYSARDAIVEAARRFEREGNREDFRAMLGAAPDVDLLIRTGGEQRLSDFMLWECAYAELIFTRKMWPDFTVQDLEAAVAEFYSRERRFGRVPAAAAG